MKRYLSLLLTIFLCGCSPKAPTVGIIGGSDGPTQIILASRNIVRQDILPVVIVAIILVFIIVYTKKKK